MYAILMIKNNMKLIIECFSTRLYYFNQIIFSTSKDFEKDCAIIDGHNIDTSIIMVVAQKINFHRFTE